MTEYSDEVKWTGYRFLAKYVGRTSPLVEVRGSNVIQHQITAKGNMLVRLAQKLGAERGLSEMEVNLVVTEASKQCWQDAAAELDGMSAGGQA